MSNRRRQYRVRPAIAKQIQIELIGPRVRTSSVRLLDLSAAGAGLELPRSVHGLLRSGDLMHLKISSDRLAEPLVMNGRLCHVDEGAEQPRVGLRFVDWRKHRDALDVELKGLFNEREAFRVEALADRPVRLEVECGTGLVVGRLRDLSLLGIGLQLDRAGGPITDEAVSLRLFLPTLEAPVLAVAEVRYVGALALGTQVGLELVADRREQTRLQRVLAPWIMERQRALARLGLARVV